MSAARGRYGEDRMEPAPAG